MKIAAISFGKRLPGVSALKKSNAVSATTSRISGITVDYAQISENPASITPKSIAKGIEVMKRAEAEGRYKDITNSVL